MTKIKVVERELGPGIVLSPQLQRKLCSATSRGRGGSTLTARTFMLRGVLKNGTRTRYSINSEDFMITDETWVVGTPTIGAGAQVKGIIFPGIGYCATKVVVTP